MYLSLAVKDLVRIAEFVVSIGHPDPHTYVDILRLRLESMHDCKNPGVVGRRTGTMEWILSPAPYVAVIRWAGADAKIYRVLPSAKMKVSRPRILGGLLRRS
jgi:hypothetical protein